ncbi:hypothetical protein VNI00_000179 [Paramarasmius palmivorus]|uniref:Uncharacterized protein n=1 Tax=Paramarasmius palmivorus TaxID=297713 RepID=A0AAW0EGA4_9AGAR
MGLIGKDQVNLAGMGIQDQYFGAINRTNTLYFGQAQQVSSGWVFQSTEKHIDIGGNAGILSIGELPSGVKNESLTWVPLRTYPPEEGGLNGPPDSPGEVYPIAWEIPIDDVYFDGEKLPRSTLAAPDISLSALIDTVSSIKGIGGWAVS